MRAHRATQNGGWINFQHVDVDEGEDTATAELINILDSVEFPIVVVRPDLTLACFNKVAADMLGLSSLDVDRASREVRVLAGLPRLEQHCLQAINDGVESRVDFSNGGKWFVVRISPYTKRNGQVVGAVLTFTNVTAFRASVDQAIYEREATKAIVNAVASPLVVLSSDQRILTGNRAFYKMFGVSRDETQGSPIYEIGNGALDLVTLHRQLGEIFIENHGVEPIEIDIAVTTKGQRTLILEAYPLALPGHSEHRILVTFQDVTERKLAEAAKDLRSAEELRRSEAFLAEAQRLSLTGSFSWQVTTNELVCSEQFYRIFEFDLGTTVTLDLIGNRVYSEDASLFHAMIDRARKESAFDCEFRLQMPDQALRYLHVIAHATCDKDGRVEYIGAVSDVTARKRAEEDVRQSEAAAEQRLRLVVDTAPVLITSARPDGYVDYINKRLLEYLGLSLSDIEGRGWSSTIHPDDAPAMLDKWKATLASGKAAEDHEARVRRFDGVYRWFLHRSAPMYDQNGQIVRWFGTAIDIEDRKNSEEALRRSEAFLAEGQRLSSTGSFCWKVANDEITWSEQFYRIFGFEQGSSLTVEQISTRVHPEDGAVFRDIVDRARKARADFDYEFRLLMPDQSVKYLHIIAHGMKDRAGQLEYIGAAQDVTQRQLAEAALTTARSELARVARITSLGVLTASIAHEVNQPLTAVTNNGHACLRLLARGNLDSEVLRRALEEIVADGTRASGVIARIRALITKTPSERSELDVNVAIHEVLELLGREIQKNSVFLEYQLADTPLHVLVDRVQLQQVLLNLIMNAIEAMTAIPDQRRVLRVESRAVDAGDVLVAVSDSGPGFGSEADRIFVPFFTTKSTGVGMGLSICRSIIEDHGGRVWATSNLPHGAVLSFTLPQAGRGLA